MKYLREMIFTISLLLYTNVAISFEPSSYARSFQFVPVYIDNLNQQFFLDIFNRHSSEASQDKYIVDIGLKHFSIYDKRTDEIKVCHTKRHKIWNAFVSPNGKYILTTSSENIADIYDSDGRFRFAINDSIAGIQLAIWQSDLTIVTRSRSDHRLNKIWMLPPDTLLHPPNQKMALFAQEIKSYINEIKIDQASLDGFFEFLSQFVSKTFCEDERKFFHSLDPATKVYLLALLPERKKSKL